MIEDLNPGIEWIKAHRHTYNSSLSDALQAYRKYKLAKFWNDTQDKLIHIDVSNLPALKGVLTEFLENAILLNIV